MLASAAISTSEAWAKSPKRPGASGVSRSIHLRAFVRPFCKLSKMHRGLRLSGRSDTGANIDSTVAGDGGFTVICNKPYAMNLERVAVWGTPRFAPRLRRAAADDPFGLRLGRAPVFGAPDLFLQERQVASANVSDAFALARVTPEPQSAARDFEVVLSVDLNDGPLQSSCVMGSAEASHFVCHAFPGADGARLPLPRMDARMSVTGAEVGTPAFASEASDIPPQTMLPLPAAAAFPGAERRVLAAAGGSDTIAVLDSVVRQQRTGDRLTISVTAKY